MSLLIKQGTSTSSVVELRDNTALANRILVAITWSSGVPVLTFTTGSQERAPEPLGNGIYRIFLLSTSVTAANSNVLAIYPATDAALVVANTGTVYIGGVQAENATAASSLMPTTTATVARNADVLTYPAAGNVNESGGSAYLEWFQKTVPASTSQIMYQIDDGSNVSLIKKSRVSFPREGASIL